MPNMYGLFFKTKEKMNEIWDDFDKITSDKIYKKYHYSQKRFNVAMENGDIYVGMMIDYPTCGTRLQGCYVEKGIMDDKKFLYGVVHPCLFPNSENEKDMLFVIEIVD